MQEFDLLLPDFCFVFTGKDVLFRAPLMQDEMKS